MIYLQSYVHVLPVIYFKGLSVKNTNIATGINYEHSLPTDPTSRDAQPTQKTCDAKPGLGTNYPQPNHNLFQMIKCHEDSLLRLHHLTTGRQATAYEPSYQPPTWYPKDLERPFMKPQYLAHYEDGLRRKYQESKDAERESGRVGACWVLFLFIELGIQHNHGMERRRRIPLH